MVYSGCRVWGWGGGVNSVERLLETHFWVTQAEAKTSTNGSMIFETTCRREVQYHWLADSSSDWYFGACITLAARYDKEMISSCGLVTFTSLWVKSADDNLMIFFLFFPGKRGLTFQETVCMKFQTPFSGKKSKCSLLNFLPNMLCVNQLGLGSWHVLFFIS